MRCLSIHLTDLCNSKCTFCVVASPLYTKDTVNYDEVVAFLRAHAGTYDVVNFHGGEPTIHPKFLETLALIQELGYREVHLQTNATRLSDEAFARRTVELGVKLFIISLHGDDPQTHDTQTHTPGGFNRVIASIQNVKALGARVRTNTVVTRANLQRLPSIARVACDAGVDHFNISNIHPVGSALFALGRILPSFEEVRAHLYPAIDHCQERGRRVTLEGFPYCSVAERRDLHLNNEYRDIRMMIRGRVIDDYDAFMSDSMRVFGSPCQGCGVRKACGGVYREYISYRGWNEFHPLPGPAVEEAVSEVPATVAS